MGRGGGSSMGGGSSFRGGGASRTHYGSGSRGGFSGGAGRSGGGFRGAPMGGPPFGGGPRPPRRPPYPRFIPVYRRRYGYVGAPIGCGSVILITLVLAVCLALALIPEIIVGIANSGGQITASTVERSKLPAKDCKLTDDWFEDGMSPKWIHNDRDLIKGLREFYNKTGVQPYLVLMPSVDGDKYPTQSQIDNKLAEIYDAKISDEGHVVVGFIEGVSDEYAIGVYAGNKAEIVMDAEACDILMDYLEYYYESDLSDEEYFVTAFEKTADKIMTVDEIKSVSTAKTIRTVAIVGGGALIVIVIAVAVVKFKKHKAEQAKADAEILKSNLSENSDTDTLKDKYNVK